MKTTKSKIYSNQKETSISLFPKDVELTCEELLSMKNQHNSISSKYLKTIREKEDDLIPVLNDKPFKNRLGSISTYNRVFFNISEEDYIKASTYCKENKMNIKDLIEMKVVYKATPLLRKAIISGNGMKIPLLKEIKKNSYSYLKIQLSI